MESFLRSEKKYLLDKHQYQELRKELENYVKADKFPSSKVYSIYYDNDDYCLITKSIEKPMFKEKLRIRSYGQLNDDDTVYVELKKKFDGVVYKKRTTAKYGDAIKNIKDCDFKDVSTGNEIKHLISYYGDLKPKVFIGSNRFYFIGKQDNNLRITFDEDITYRIKDVYLNESNYDKKLNDKCLMEIKVLGTIPLWLSRILDRLHIYSSSFSKVGNVFLKEKDELIYDII